MRVFLEIEEGLYKIKVSGYSASTPSHMHKRGREWPASLKPEYQSAEEAIKALRDMTDYYAEKKKASQSKKGI